MAPRRQRRPQESGPLVRGRGRWRDRKPTLLRKNAAPAYTGASFCKPAEKHPAEGMTKVIPALSCKHDNCEAHGMRERLSSTPQGCKQRGGFNRSGRSAGPS